MNSGKMAAGYIYAQWAKGEMLFCYTVGATSMVGNLSLRDLQALCARKRWIFLGMGKALERALGCETLDFAGYRGMVQLPQALKKRMLAHSFGGQVAIVLAAEHPELVSKLVLTSVPVPDCWKTGRTRKSDCAVCLSYSAQSGIRGCWSAARAAHARSAGATPSGSPDYRGAIPVHAANVQSRDRAKPGSLLPKIRAATLLIWGGEDTAAPLLMRGCWKNVCKTLDWWFRARIICLFAREYHDSAIGNFN